MKKFLLKLNGFLAIVLFFSYSTAIAQGNVVTEPATGVTSIEGENYYALIAGSGAYAGSSWMPSTAFPGYAGDGYLFPFSTNGGEGNTTIAQANCPAVVFRINFTQTGTHYLYTRCSYPDDGSDSYYVSWNGSNLTRMNPFSDVGGTFDTWGWNNLTSGNSSYSFNVTTTGEQDIIIYMREPNFRLDKIVIQTSQGYPTGEGPGETQDGGYIFNESPAGVTSMEAEHYFARIDGSGSYTGSSWDPSTSFPGYSEESYMTPTSTNGGEGSSVIAQANCPAIVYQINFTQTGTHYWYARCSYADDQSDSYYISWNGSNPTRMNPFTELGTNFDTWGWNASTSGGSPYSFTVTETGIQNIIVYMREPNFRLDKIVILTDQGYPMGTGPEESSEVNTDGPMISCPSYINQDNDPGQCGAVVTFNVSASDGATVSCVPPSGSFFDIGTTEVTCTATDVLGNMDVCSFDVTVNEAEPCFWNYDADGIGCTGGQTVDLNGPNESIILSSEGCYSPSYYNSYDAEGAIETDLMW